MVNNQDVERLLKKIRELLGIRQEKLAAQLGVTFSLVNRWENGHRKPSPLAMRGIEELANKIGVLTEVQRPLSMGNGGIF